MDIKKSTALTLMVLLVITTISCGLLGELASRATSAGETAREAIEQAQGLATQSHVIRGTAKAFTEQNPSLVNTAQAFLSEEGPGLLETGKAMATQHPGLLETAQALIDQGFSGDELPDNIPVPEGIVILYSSSEAVSYITPLGFQEIMDYHHREMINAGWTPVADGTLQTGDSAILNYSQEERRASVSVNYNSADGNTFVLVTVH